MITPGALWRRKSPLGMNNSLSPPSLSSPLHQLQEGWGGGGGTEGRKKFGSLLDEHPPAPTHQPPSSTHLSFHSLSHHFECANTNDRGSRRVIYKATSTLLRHLMPYRSRSESIADSFSISRARIFSTLSSLHVRTSRRRWIGEKPSHFRVRRSGERSPSHDNLFHR